MTNVLSSTATPTTPKSPQMTRLSQRHFMTSPGSSPYPSSPRAGRQLGIGSPTDNEVRLHIVIVLRLFVEEKFETGCGNDNWSRSLAEIVHAKGRDLGR